MGLGHVHCARQKSLSEDQVATPIKQSSHYCTRGHACILASRDLVFGKTSEVLFLPEACIAPSVPMKASQQGEHFLMLKMINKMIFKTWGVQPATEEWIKKMWGLEDGISWSNGNHTNMSTAMSKPATLACTLAASPWGQEMWQRPVVPWSSLTTQPGQRELQIVSWIDLKPFKFKNTRKSAVCLS